MNAVHVRCDGVPRPPWLGGIARFCRAVLRELGADGSELSVLFAGEQVMRELNRAYRGIDSSTDVLAFSQLEGRPFPRGGAARAVGDVVICLPVAERQARELGSPLEQEVRRLLVHGILHLAGMDHERDAGRMLGLQETILERLGELGS